MTVLSERRTAILAALAAAVTVVLQSIQGAEGGDPRSGIYVALLAIGAAATAYLAAFQVAGLHEKLAITALATTTASVAAGVLAGRSGAEIALTALLVGLGTLGVQASLPSTAGSAAE
jgi:hypothetical protein